MSNPNLFDLPADIAEQLSHSISNDDGVALPFATLGLYWRNGQSAARPVGGATYFGGWQADAEKADDVVRETGSTLPASFVKVTLTNKEGGEYDAYNSRSIAIAPIAVRRKFDGRSAINVLGYMAELVDGKLEPWGPVVLSAKGMVTNSIEKAFKTWDAKTKALRGNAPLSAFYAVIGTFGEKPVVEMVGKASKSPITPCQLYHIDDEVTIEVLQKRFVGGDTALIMAELRVKAQPWLDEWAKAKPVNGSAPLPEDIPVTGF